MSLVLEKDYLFGRKFKGCLAAQTFRQYLEYQNPFLIFHITNALVNIAWRSGFVPPSPRTHRTTTVRIL